ncbi:hypothetical protein DL96DRAFT_859882 [Flagelloscypha sp. PMI_526]|nr:hypothetical protein DL96DRAFT_859882 [Flagelloscypha sp. PMI_526]
MAHVCPVHEFAYKRTLPGEGPFEHWLCPPSSLPSFDRCTALSSPMSLGPSFIHLTARNLNFFDNFSSHVTRDINSVSSSTTDSGTTGSSETLEQLGQMTGPSTTVPLNDEGSVPSSMGNDNEQGDTMPEQNEAQGASPLIPGPLPGGIIKTSGAFSPSRYYGNLFRRSAGLKFDERDSGVPAPKIFQKMHGIMKGVAMRELD